MSKELGRTLTAVDEKHRPPRLAVVYEEDSCSPMELSRMAGGRWETVFLVGTADEVPNVGSSLLRRFGTLVEVAGRDPSDLARVLERERVSGVISFSDGQLPLAAAISQELGLPGNPPDVVEALTDKHVQRRRLRQAGLPVPANAQIRRTAAATEVLSAVEGLETPLVVKPRRGESSRATLLVPDLRSLVELVDADLSRLPGQDDLVVEEWLADGPSPGVPGLANYVSVEAIAHDGMVFPLAVTGKFALAPPFRERGNCLPHPLSRADTVAVLDVAAGSARALGVRSGALHIEVKLTPSGPRLIEVNGRVGGGGIDGLYERRHGRSLKEWAICEALGGCLDPPGVELEVAEGPFVYRYFVQPPEWACRIASVGNVDLVLGLKEVDGATLNRSAGQPVDWRLGSQEYVVSFTGAADGLAELGQLPARIDELLDIRYDRG
ncbi:MAG: ATP-grasp domain-containing protein [Acidimicrobiales bacterium]